MTAPVLLAGANVEGWPQLGEIGLAFVLSAVIGAEREVRQKSAGLRTHTLVGVGAALFTLVSKYGFSDVLEPGRVVLDPSRVAAQIVSGIGFVGAGLIFVRRDSVRGLTTAVAVWVTAAVGAAAGAGLPLLAGAGTVGYLIVALVFPWIMRFLPSSSSSVSTLRLSYPDGQGTLRRILETTTRAGFAVDGISSEPLGLQRAAGVEGGLVPMVGAVLQVHGSGSMPDLLAALSDLAGVQALAAEDSDAGAE